jgi:hypothetical protein
MKKIRLIIILSFVILFSCSKSENSTNQSSSYEVEYEINNPNIYIVQVSYTDSNGNILSVNDLSTFTNGKKKISVTKKNFTASISVSTNNTSLETIRYALSIKVDGVLKIYENKQTPPMSTSLASVEFLIQ